VYGTSENIPFYKKKKKKNVLKIEKKTHTCPESFFERVIRAGPRFAKLCLPSIGMALFYVPANASPKIGTV